MIVFAFYYYYWLYVLYIGINIMHEKSKMKRFFRQAV